MIIIIFKKKSDVQEANFKAFTISFTMTHTAKVRQTADFWVLDSFKLTQYYWSGGGQCAVCPGGIQKCQWSLKTQKSAQRMYYTIRNAGFYPFLQNWS